MLSVRSHGLELSPTGRIRIECTGTRDKKNVENFLAENNVSFGPEARKNIWGIEILSVITDIKAV